MCKWHVRCRECKSSASSAAGELYGSRIPNEQLQLLRENLNMSWGGGGGRKRSGWTQKLQVSFGGSTFTYSRWCVKRYVGSYAAAYHYSIVSWPLSQAPLFGPGFLEEYIKTTSLSAAAEENVESCSEELEKRWRRTTDFQCRTNLNTARALKKRRRRGTRRQSTRARATINQIILP